MKINENLGIKYPIIQGAMANIALAELAAAVSNAGGLGVIGSGGWDGDRLRDEIIKCRKLTDKPFGVNIMLLNPKARELSQVCIEEKVEIITTGAGSPARYIKAWHEAGIKVLPVVPHSGAIKKLDTKYGDFITAYIVEGTEAGGHIGELTTMVNVPICVNATKKPIIAAGGIASGQQLAAAFAMGAKGAQIGTAFLTAEECPIHDNYKQKIIDASEMDTVVTGRINGLSACRIIGNEMSKKFIELEKNGGDPHELEVLTLGSLRKAVQEGDTNMGSVMAGQVVGMVNKKDTCKNIIENLMREAKQVIDNLSM